jgi:glycolate oxidase iron-sulfur subunit
MRAMEALMPEAAEGREDPGVHLSHGRAAQAGRCPHRLRPAVFFSQVNSATVRVLAAEGCEWLLRRTRVAAVPSVTHAGREEESLNFARKTIETFGERTSTTWSLTLPGVARR